jgi:hypothetical protein
MRAEHEDLLRRLALNEEDVLASLLGPGVSDAEPVRLAGLVALEPAPATVQWSVTNALAAGASDGEVVAVLVALAPIVGTVRVSSAAPEIALAIGCDIGTPATG